MASVSVQMLGQAELMRIQLSDENLAQTVRTSANDLVQATRRNAPIYRGKPSKWVVPGALRQGIIRSRSVEATNKPHKIVYDLVFDAEKNEIFQKFPKKPTKKGQYYYPASQEYGFRTRAKPGAEKRGTLTRVDGRYFMRNTAAAYASVFEQNVSKTVDKILK